METLFIPYQIRENLELYKEFFSKFKNYSVFLLLNGSECIIHHEVMTTLLSIIKNNHIEKFIEDYFAEDDIISYAVYKINASPSGETWDTLIASTHYTPYLSKLLENILVSKNHHLGGIYFLSLEFKTIIDKILKNTLNTKFNNYLQIFVCILNSGGIKLVVKHQGNIISAQTFEYPSDKSDLYIQGVIEQEIENCLISSKAYIDDLALDVCLIFIVNHNLKLLLQSSDFGAKHTIHTIIYEDSDVALNGQEIGGNYQSSQFADELIVKLFNEQKSFPASNKFLKCISKLNIINRWSFKLLITIIMLLISANSIIKIKTLLNYQKVTSLNDKYFTIEEDYNKLKQKYAYIPNLTNLANLYVFESLLQIPVPTPFELLEKFLISSSSNIYIEEVKWYLLDQDNALLSANQNMQSEILLKFITYNMSVEDSIKLLEQQIINYNTEFKDMIVQLTILNAQVVNLSDRVVIPAIIVITKQKG
jgi:hypothetical protein